MESVVLYGLGYAGKSILPYIRKNYHILYWVDSNPELWGTEYEGISIQAPESLYGYEGKVIVTTTDSFFIEISVRLISMGILKEQIYRGQHNCYNQNEEVIPYEYSMLLECKDVGKALEEYDMLHKREQPGQLRIMIFCAFYSVYTNGIVKNLKMRYPDIQISVLANSEQYYEPLAEYAAHIYVYCSYRELMDIVTQIPVYDVFQFLWIENIWVYFADILREKCKKMNLCVGGSDLYRSKKGEVEYKKKLIDMADLISAETDGTICDFAKVYPETEKKIRWVNFGVETIDLLESGYIVDVVATKKRYRLSQDKLIVTCGHNANDAHQHLDIIDALKKLDSKLASKITFVFPMTYPVGNQSYIEKVREKLEISGLDYRILTNFMDVASMAEYAVISDIMIHVQTTDQLSSTMLEEMYTGTIVIAGSWLPYGMLKDKEIFFLSIDDIKSLDSYLEDVISNYQNYKEQCIQNKKRIKSLSSWDNVSERWISLWK